jgi:hypothetical protein
VTEVPEIAGGDRTATSLSLVAHPNPLTPESRITFRLPEGARARLAIYDVTGRRVAELVNEYHAAGEHSIPLDVAALPAGVFFARLETPGGATSTRSLYMK